MHINHKTTSVWASQHSHRYYLDSVLNSAKCILRDMKPDSTSRSFRLSSGSRYFISVSCHKYTISGRVNQNIPSPRCFHKCFAMAVNFKQTSHAYHTFIVIQTYSNYGDRCFAAAGLKLWKSVPDELQQADISFQWFKWLLKTFLFGCWDRGALWLTVEAAPHKFSYWLTY